MSRPTLKLPWLDMSDPAINRQARNALAALRGRYRITAEPTRETRSNAANRYWWGVIVQAFYAFLREQDYEIRDPEEAHAILKEKLIGPRRVYKPGTNVVVAKLPPTTHDMTPEEFGELITRGRAWLLDQLGIDTPDPGEHVLNRLTRAGQPLTAAGAAGVAS